MAWRYATALNVPKRTGGQTEYPLKDIINSPKIAVKIYCSKALERSWIRAGWLEVYTASSLGNLLVSSHNLQFDQQIIELPSEPITLVYRPRFWIPNFTITVYKDEPPARLSDMLKLGYHSYYLSGVWDFGLNNDPIQRVTPTTDDASLLVESADSGNPAHDGLFYRFYNLNEYRTFTVKPKDPSKNSGTPDTIVIPYGFTDILYVASQDFWISGKVLL